jgi:RNA polymerase sigma-70 factor (ECF subfamily)
MVHGAATRTAHGAAVDLRLLITRAQEGDRAALEELYLLHFDRIYGYLQTTLRNRHDAEDLTTQTFVRMLESIGRFRWQSAPFSAWLFRIAHNLAIDHFRVRSRVLPEDNLAEGDEESAEEQALHAIGQAGMLELIDRLPTEQRQVLMLKFLCGFGNTEVAAILDKTEGAVKSLQHRALASLERQLVQP